MHDDLDANARPKVTLVGEDGNAFNIIARCLRAMRDAGWSQGRIDAVVAEMTSGDHDHLLQVAIRHFDVE